MHSETERRVSPDLHMRMPSEESKLQPNESVVRQLYRGLLVGFGYCPGINPRSLRECASTGMRSFCLERPL